MKNIFSVLLLLISIFANANVKLPAVFSDNMVLQQKTNAAIWGTADPNSTIKIFTSWNKKSYMAMADANGNWKFKLVTPAYGGPYNIHIEQGNKIDLKNVLIGEVWVCSGQSNMEMPLAGWGQVLNYKDEIANANYPQIRLLQAIRTTSNTPLQDLKVRNNGWDICTPETIADFSSTAYFFAREVYNKTKIPVGLIHTSWGGTIAEAWTSYETLKTLPDFAAAALKIKNEGTETASSYPEKMSQWENSIASKDLGYKNGWEKIDFDANSWSAMKIPSYWDDNELQGFDGAVWYRKRIEIPQSWMGQELTLSLGPVDDDDVTWFNGTKVGETIGYGKERVYKIPASLVKENNLIAVRIFDGSGNGGIIGDASKIYLVNNKDEKIELNGHWPYKISVNLKDVSGRPADPNSPNRPTVLFNAMINPIVSYTIRGVIWYQGESNAGRAYQYRTLFPAMINDWRAKFSSGDFPFYFVQLANFMKKENKPGPSAWAELREAQLLTTKLKKTGMATIIDIGDAVDIHPKNKQEVGRRLSLIALNKIYGKQNEYSGPLYQSYKKQGDKIILTFEHAKGLHVKGNRVLGFSMAGADRKFYWADAKIQGNKIIVSSNEVADPVAVRYGWANNPDVNLFNDAHLPASPFRTDDWGESTYNNK